MKTKEQLIQIRQEIVKAFNIECDKRDAACWLPDVVVNAETFEFCKNDIIIGEGEKGSFLYFPLDGLLKIYTHENGLYAKNEWIDNRKNMDDYLKNHPEENISLKDKYPIFDGHQLTTYMKDFFTGLKKSKLAI